MDLVFCFEWSIIIRKYLEIFIIMFFIFDYLKVIFVLVRDSIFFVGEGINMKRLKRVI